ncbi:MAG TPA: flagellar basal body P-ring formation chaperone FlgA [Solimonas sp.]|nr:flagellar basal body P-ring formation chaperone FlgA [Solimonas sp.]
MKSLLTCLLLLCCAAAPAADEAQSLTTLRDAAVAAVRAQSAPGVQLEAVALDERLRLPACAEVLRAAPENARGNQQRVAVSCTTPAAWTIYVGVRISDVRPVLMLARSVQRGEAIDAAMLIPQERDVATLPYGYYSDPAELAGRQFKRAASAGSLLTPEMVESQKLVRRGDLVTVVGRAGSVEVRSQGKALRDGARGDSIPIENSSSRRIVQGRVTAGGEVEVRL